MSSVVYIVVLNWNNASETINALRSLSRSDYPGHEIVVVDNGSTDDSIAVIRADFPGVHIIGTGENLGYAGGNNVGIHYALAQGADYIWLFNDDAIAAPDALSALMRAAQTDPDAGFLGPTVQMRERPDQILSAGGYLDSDLNPRQRGLGEINQGQYQKIEEVDFLSGCALLISRASIEAVGLLDERFFTYGEDVEWCFRGKLHGLKVLFVPQALVWHPDTRSRDENSARVMYYMSRNRLLFLRKHRLGFAKMARTLSRNTVWLLNWSINPKWRHAKPKRDALWLAMRDFALGRFGKSSEF